MLDRIESNGKTISLYNYLVGIWEYNDFDSCYKTKTEKSLILSCKSLTTHCN